MARRHSAQSSTPDVDGLAATPAAQGTQAATERSRPARFTSEVEAVVGRLQRVLGDLAGELTKQSLRPNALAEAFGLDRSLAWKLSRLIQAPDGLTAARHLPGRPGLNLILESLAHAGADRDRIAQAREYVHEIELLVQRHAGKKSEFRAMLRAYETDSRVDPREIIRRDAFRTSAAAWGVQAQAQIAIHAIRRSESDPSTFDLLAVNGHVGIRRLRPDVPWTINRPSLRDHPNDEKIGPQHLPLVPSAVSEGENGIPIYEAFCSHPRPELRVFRLANGTAEVQLAEGPVGQTAEQTVIFAKKILRAVRCSTPDKPNVINNAAHVATPAEWLVSDFLVHQSSFDGIEPDAASHAELGMWPWFAEDNRRPLERLALKRLQTEPQLLRMESLPRHHEMILHAMDHAGWNREEFVLYRLVQRYPLLSTVSVITLPVPGDHRAGEE